MHVLDSDEIFHFYLGDPVEMLQLLPDGRSAVFTLGADLQAGITYRSWFPRACGRGRGLLATARWRCWDAA